MDAFLYSGDYYRQIQADNLSQIIGNNNKRLDEATQTAMLEVSDLLKGKYDMLTAFAPITQHDKTKVYKAGATVYLNAPAYSATATYPTIGTQVLQAGYVYSSNTVISAHEAFTIGHWTLIGEQYEIYNAMQPNYTFDYLTYYRVGAVVFWNDKICTALKETQVLDHQAKLNIGVQMPSDILNIFPDDPIYGSLYWSSAAYTVPATTLITNATYWQLGDNRDQKLLQVCIDIALYHLHSRISPRNIPDLRITRYMGEPNDRIATKNKIIYPMYSALGWCQNTRTGDDITPSMPEIQPKSGQRILASSNAKNNNSY